MHIAEQQLGLLGGALAAPAGSWRSDGDLPWALASQLAPLALHSGALSTEQAAGVALGACGAVEAALKPVLQQDDSASEPSVHGSPMHAQLPTPAFVAAAAALAAQTAGSLAEQEAAVGVLDGPGADAAEQVTDTLLLVCEDCTASVAELGVGDRASDALLNICIAVARQLLPLLTGAGERDAGSLTDQLPRLQAVLVRCLLLRAVGSGRCCVGWVAMVSDAARLDLEQSESGSAGHTFPLPSVPSFFLLISLLLCRVLPPGWLSWSTSSLETPLQLALEHLAPVQVCAGPAGRVAGTVLAVGGRAHHAVCC